MLYKTLFITTSFTRPFTPTFLLDFKGGLLTWTNTTLLLLKHGTVHHF